MAKIGKSTGKTICFVKMRKIFLLYIATLAFTSCSTDKFPNLAEENGETITFGKMETRTPISNASDIDAFGVFAEKSMGAPDTDGAAQFVNILANEKVYPNPENNLKWTYNNPAYWVYDRIFHFFAVYPYNNSLNLKPERVEKLTQLNDENKYLGYKIPFIVPEDAATDLMLAKKEVIVPSNPIEHLPVNLTFTHALSKISIKATKHSDNENNKIIAKKITLSGIWKTGTLYTSPFSDYKDNWDFYGAATMEITREGTWELGKESDDTPVLMQDLLLMSQEIELEQILVTLTYDYYANSGDIEPTEKDLVAEKYVTKGEWLPTTQYTYSLELSAVDNEIKFGTPKVTSWGNPQSGGTVIIQ